MADKPLEISKKGDDGYKFFSVRVKETTMEALDRIAAETNRSRNDVVNIMLEYGIDNAIIK